MEKLGLEHAGSLGSCLCLVVRCLATASAHIKIYLGLRFQIEVEEKCIEKRPKTRDWPAIELSSHLVIAYLQYRTSNRDASLACIETLPGRHLTPSGCIQ